MDQLTVEREGGTQLSVAQAEGTGGDAVEHRLDIVGGARDDPQDLACRRLLLSRLDQLAAAHLELREGLLQSPLERTLPRAGVLRRLAGGWPLVWSTGW